MKFSFAISLFFPAVEVGVHDVNVWLVLKHTLAVDYTSVDICEWAV